MEKPPEVGARVAVVLPPKGLVTAVVAAVRIEKNRILVRVRLGPGDELEYPLGAIQPLN